MSSIVERDLPFQHPKEIDISTNLRNTYDTHQPSPQFHRNPQMKRVHLDLAIWLKVCGRSHLNCLCLNRPKETSYLTLTSTFWLHLQYLGIQLEE